MFGPSQRKEALDWINYGFFRLCWRPYSTNRADDGRVPDISCTRKFFQAWGHLVAVQMGSDTVDLAAGPHFLPTRGPKPPSSMHSARDPEITKTRRPTAKSAREQREPFEDCWAGEDAMILFLLFWFVAMGRGRPRLGGRWWLLLTVALLHREFGGSSVFTAPECVRIDDFSLEILLSKALSIAVIAGSCIGKMPQVLAVWQAKSAQGLSKVSIWTEAVSMGVQLSYNIVRHTPLTTYAEVAILFPQMLILTVVVAWADAKLGPRVWIACTCLCTGVVLMSTGLVPATVTAAAYAAVALLGIVAVLPQVVINYKNKSTGQLSFLVTGMTFGGMGARLYTTFVEVDDIALRATMLLNFSLVSTLMMQFAIYRDTRPLPPKPTEIEIDLEPESPAERMTPKPFKRQNSMVQ
ncbi:unnamed protein product, partial [Symbiodinium microadriaticum]